MAKSSIGKALSKVHSAANQLAFILIVVVICGVFVFPLFYDRKKVRAVKTELAELGSALADYHAETGKWPAAGARSVATELSGGEGKKAFSAHERRDAEGRFIDPWETPYRFYFSENGYVIRGAGDDGKFQDGPDEKADDYWYSPK